MCRIPFSDWILPVISLILPPNQWNMMIFERNFKLLHFKEKYGCFSLLCIRRWYDRYNGIDGFIARFYTRSVISLTASTFFYRVFTVPYHFLNVSSSNWPCSNLPPVNGCVYYTKRYIMRSGYFPFHQYPSSWLKSEGALYITWPSLIGAKYYC